MNDDGQLRQWLGAHRSAVNGGSPTDHPDIDTLTRHATAQLSPGKARIVSEHLMVCEDGRCVSFVRASAEDVDAAAALLYPDGEAEGLHARTFLCREALWEQFEELAREQGAPIDELLSEAMRSYARQRSSQSVQQPPSQSQPSHPQPQAYHQSAHDYEADGDDELARTAMIRQPTQRMAPFPSGQTASAQIPAPPPPRGAGMPNARALPPPGRGPMPRPLTAPGGQGLPAPPPGRSGAARYPTGGGGGMPMAPPSRAMSPQPRSMPPPLPPPSDPAMPAAPLYEAQGAQARGGMRSRVATQLSLTYLGRSVDVTKERFLLGRSKTQADLVLDDANVSRQHAAIEHIGETWVLADLGSTNGCYIDGQRVSRRELTDGDVIEITTHQVRVTLR